LSIAYWSVLVHLPLYLATALGFDAKTSGLALLAATLPMLLLPGAAATLLGRLGPRHFLTLGLVIGAAGNLALSLGTGMTPVLAGMLLA
ncbi:hypothetical protein ABTA79_19540, partial [Acinetobacter baumannii]